MSWTVRISDSETVKLSKRIFVFLSQARSDMSYPLPDRHEREGLHQETSQNRDLRNYFVFYVLCFLFSAIVDKDLLNVKQLALKTQENIFQAR